MYKVNDQNTDGHILYADSAQFFQDEKIKKIARELGIQGVEKKELSEKNPPQAMFIGRLNQYADLSGNTDPFCDVDLKISVLAAIEPKENVWKNPLRGHRSVRGDELKPLQQILENRKNSLRQKK
ncbi:hypothetical protein CAEBREN_07631 [Caenorhabditis brenneri]|uniref:Uncharacterized protein n=1 Tax=Caenorhabditis brenneri TaxID=135651 RepID=G0NGI3_CAEBE|nr:hypothetical protein CAEBREN_07631 [Caenorhabditis brenneri]